MIEFENAGFGQGRAAILAPTSLTITPGSFCMLVGPSGSGKTTFLRLCHMDLAPTTGRVRVFGRKVRPRDRNGIADLRRGLGMLSQDSRFLDHLTLVENIALPLQIAGIDLIERADDLQALLEWIDLGEQVGMYPPALSASERQRAALARAVILSPEMILADEPCGNLDDEMGLRLLTLLVELNRMGKTVVIATHDQDLPRAVASMVTPRVLQIAGGQIGASEHVQ